MTENRIEIVKRNCDELTEAWRNEEYKHDTYTIFLDNSEVEANEEWILELQRSFNDKFCFKEKLNFSERKKKLGMEPDIKLYQLQEKTPPNEAYCHVAGQ